jgi:hypothetical protein
MNDNYESQGYCDVYSNWYDNYNKWYPEVAVECATYGATNASMGLAADGAFSWTETNSEKWCDCVEALTNPKLNTICAKFPIFTSMSNVSLAVFMVTMYIVLTIMGWETNAETYRRMLECKHHLRKQYPKDIHRYNEILDASFRHWRQSLPSWVHYSYYLLSALGSMSWLYKGMAFVTRLDVEGQLIILFGWMLQTWIVYLMFRTTWQAYALFTENYSIVRTLGRPQNFQSLQGVQCWWAVREYSLNYKLALNYRLNEFSFSVLFVATVCTIAFVVSRAFTQITNLLAPSSCAFMSVSGVLTTILVCLMNIATTIYQGQQAHAKMLHEEEHKMETMPQINPAQLGASMKFMSKATALMKYDRPPMVFGIPIKPEAFYGLIAYIGLAMASVAAKSFTG